MWSFTEGFPMKQVSVSVQYAQAPTVTSHTPVSLQVPDPDDPLPHGCPTASSFGLSEHELPESQNCTLHGFGLSPRQSPM